MAFATLDFPCAWPPGAPFLERQDLSVMQDRFELPVGRCACESEEHDVDLSRVHAGLEER